MRFRPAIKAFCSSVFGLEHNLQTALASPPCVDVEKVRERIKVLMEQCGHANSHSIYTAFMQLANEFSQGVFGLSDAPADVELTEFDKQEISQYLESLCDEPDAELRWIIAAIKDAGYNIVRRNLIRTEPTDGGE